jgi:hypothetical protein
MEIPKVRRFIVRHCDRERVVELDHGPFKLAANDGKEYYEGWVMPETKDPYGEPYHVVFAAESIVREIE